MLVLISFGLVLVAIVLLVLGLLAGTGLTLIYASIASSLAAGIVLVVAKVAGRPAEEAPARPAPARQPEPVGAGTTASVPTPSPAETTAPVPVAAQEPSYAPTSRQPAMAGAAVGAGGAATLGGVGDDEVGEMGDENEDEDFFPIEDYDRLKVSEIVPLLPELYEDELDMVEQRERAGKGRVSILNRIAELRTQSLEDEPEPVTPAEAPVADEDEDFFPIEDYDELSVGEILPLLPELYDDELDVVEDRERATKSRAVILNRIGELREEAIEEAEPEPVTAAEAPVADEDEDFFPIEDYDELNVGEIVPLLPELYDDELDVVEERERATKSRAAILNRIAELRQQPLEPEPEPDTAVLADAEVPVADEDEDEDFFPIEDYDELSVGEILPLLPELYDDELDVVEERERATKSRAAILNRIAELREQPIEEAEPEPVTAAEAPLADEDEDEDEDFFPIEDYDELSVGEILPLLPELYDDEFDVVEDRERATKSRAAILNRIAELRQPPLEPEPDTAVVAAAVPVDEAEEDFFPIEDYDELKTSEILPLLPELYEDELNVVEAHERATKNRAAVLDRLAELGQETEPVPAVDDGMLEGLDQEQVAPVAAFPIGNYDQLRVSQIRALLPQLSEDELEQVRHREQGGKNRSTVLAAIDRELGVAPPAPAKKAPAKKAPAKKAPAKKAPAKKAPAKKAPAKKAPAKKAPAKKAPAKKAAAPVKRTAAPTKKASARGTTARKATAAKSPAAKKAPGKKTTARKTTAKKAAKKATRPS